MIQIVCSLCLTKIKTGNAGYPDHFCDRCLPYAEDYLQDRQRIYETSMQSVQKEMERHRNMFLQGRVLKNLKAVGNVNP